MANPLKYKMLCNCCGSYKFIPYDIDESGEIEKKNLNR